LTDHPKAPYTFFGEHFESEPPEARQLTLTKTRPGRPGTREA